MQSKNPIKLENLKRKIGKTSRMLIMGMMFLIVAMTYIGCGSSQSNTINGDYNTQGGNPSAAPDQEFVESESVANQDTKDMMNNQKLIKSGSIAVNVENMDTSTEEVNKFLASNKAYVFNSTEYNYSNEKLVNLYIKVESSNFETLMENLKTIGEVTNSAVNSSDVTREYIDTEARVNTLKAQETRLMELLSKAETVEDLLRIETELQRVRQDIESTQGQLNYLKDAVSYSTIDLNMTQRLSSVAPEGTSIWGRFVYTLKEGQIFWFEALLFLISAFLWALPVIVVGIPVYYFIIKPFRQKRAEGKKNKDARLK